MLLFSFSRLFSDVDIMLFDEIHNKRAFQIMPLNPSPFLLSFALSLLEKSFVIIIIAENATRSHHHKRTWLFSLHPHISPERERENAREEREKYSFCYHHWFSVTTINPSVFFSSPFFLSSQFLGGRTFSSGLSSWSSNYYPGCAALFLLLLFRRHHLGAVVEKGGKRFSSREQNNRNEFQSPDHIVNSKSLSMMVHVDCGFSSSLDDNNSERKETIKSERKR